MMWIMSSEEFIEFSYKNKNGRNEGKRSIWLNGNKVNKNTGKKEEYCLPKFKKFVATDFSRLH